MLGLCGVDRAEDFGETVCQLVIASCVSETVRTGDGKHTVYCMRCVMIGAHDRKSWEVKRRYSEFHDLHTRMKALGAVRSGQVACLRRFRQVRARVCVLSITYDFHPRSPRTDSLVIRSRLACAALLPHVTCPQICHRGTHWP